MSVAPRPAANPPAAPDALPSRYVVGIDLGTTNSAAAWIDSSDLSHTVHTFRIPQTTAPGQVEALDTLPSFHYEPAPGEVPAGALRLPWDAASSGKAGSPSGSPGAAGGSGQISIGKTYSVGAYARDAGAKNPRRLVVSAKSWLCHHGVDRSAALLPWQGAAEATKLSPLEASARYLQHVREAWDFAHPGFPLAEQDLALTLPASFDEVARELTVKAAARAGLPRVTLLEEPQAAFYDWLQLHRVDWQTRVQPGQKILVCDIGGGTTDFTLIRVRKSAQGGIQLHRVAVGDHLILGGDNLDLALAHFVEGKLATEGKLPNGKLPAASWASLVRTCRVVKETLLGDRPPAEAPIVVAAGGARLVAASVQTTLSKADVERVLVDGFAPRTPLDAKPQTARSGFQEFGLPFAADPAVTKHLAHFLVTHQHAGDLPDDPPPHGCPARPDVVLFNGGFFESPVLRKRILEVLAGWFSSPEKPWKPEVLANERLDLAVAHGAAYYGIVRRGQGVKISAPLARTYYLEIAGGGGAASEAGSGGEAAAIPAQALCLLPAGMEEGERVRLLDRPLDLLIRQPVEFPLHASSTRLTDRPGDLVPVDREQLSPLPPIRTVLAARKAGEADHVPVILEAGLTEIGTIELACQEQNGPRRWKLQFDVRSTVRTDLAAHEGAGEAQGVFDEAALEPARQAIRSVFFLDALATAASDAVKPEDLVKRLEESLGASRAEWPPSVLRELWATLLEVEEGRRKSPVHEARFLNLLGYSLRPGYGLAVDDWRMAQTWKLFQAKKLIHPSPACRIELLVLWRRIAGGLTAGWQLAIADPIVSFVRPQFKTLKASPVQNIARSAPRPAPPTTARGVAKERDKERSAGKSSEKPQGKTRESVFGGGGHETAETWRMLGSFELLPAALRGDLGRLALRLAPKEESEAPRAAAWWAIGRFGARQPLSGPLNGVLPVEHAEEWVDAILTLDPDDEAARLAVMLLSRCTGDRYRDLPDRLRNQAADWLARKRSPSHWVELVRRGGVLAHEETEQVFGESLPRGVRLSG